jgi:uncharacterized membrane protein (DUF4010 family)
MDDGVINLQAPGSAELALIPDLAIAIGLGMLVGIERERRNDRVAGLRTFALITLLGALSAVLANAWGGWILGAALAAVTAFLLVGNLLQLRKGDYDPGMTTEIAALVMFAAGAALMAGYRIQAVIVSASVALLLHWKQPLSGFVRRFGEGDFRALMRLALIGLVILPLLPDQTFGPYDVLNPFRIWLMVVLIVGISLAAYIAWRLAGARAGTLLGGILGGLISSTAATVGYSRAARQDNVGVGAANVMIVIASTVVFVRVLGEIAIVAPDSFVDLAPPLGVMLVFLALLSAYAWRGARATARPPAEYEPGADLRAAIAFGLLYGAVLFAVAAAREHLGEQGLYAVAALSGLTDMDAITLSTTHLVHADRLEPSTGWRLVLTAGMANLVFKAGAVALLGTPQLFRRVAANFGAALLVGLLLILFWPA